MARAYYTLCIREDRGSGRTPSGCDWRWTPQFGDYARDVVAQEAVDSYEVGPKRHIKIIKTAPTQAAINAGVAKLNA